MLDKADTHVESGVAAAITAAAVFEEEAAAAAEETEVAIENEEAAAEDMPNMFVVLLMAKMGERMGVRGGSVIM